MTEQRSELEARVVTGSPEAPRVVPCPESLRGASLGLDLDRRAAVVARRVLG